MQKESRINPAVAKLAAPAIPTALQWLDEYDGEFGKPMDFSQAVPDFAPHPALLAGLSSNAGSSQSAGYGEIQGEPALRDTYADQVSTFYGTRVDSDCVHITSGCNQAFVASLMAVAGQGDSIIMTNPGYFNHEATARMLGIELKKVNCLNDNSYLPAVRDIASLIDDTVRAVALVSPNNPCGTVYGAELLKEIFHLCQSQGIWLIVDETYRDFIPQDAGLQHRLFDEPDWHKTFIQLYSFSKSFCIPGHRLGAITAGSQLIDAVSRVMDNVQICPPRAAQLALADQIPRLSNWTRSNSATIDARASCFKTVMHAFPDWEISSIGAYFAYVRHPFDHLDCMELAQQMARDYGVLVLPGSFFGEGQERHLRVAFANADASTIQLLEPRLQLIVERLGVAAQH